MSVTLTANPGCCPVCGSFSTVSVGPTLAWCERQACFHSWNPQLVSEAREAAESLRRPATSERG